MVKVGCCGFPQGMRNYFSQFKLVEVQQTFYKMPRLETAQRWRQEAPPDFEFSLKAWQLVTHPVTSPTYRKAGMKISPGAEERYGFFKHSDEVSAAWEQTREFAKVLQAKVIVFQCPPSFKETPENIDNMKGFFDSAKYSGFVFAWEPRGDWKGSTIQAVCSELGLVHCVDPFKKEPLWGQLQYFRLHGGPGYRHHYTEEELKRLRDRVAGKDTYVLFNNLNMYQDALAFSRLLPVAGNWLQWPEIC